MRNIFEKKKITSFSSAYCTTTAPLFIIIINFNYILIFIIHNDFCKTPFQDVE